MTKIAHFNNVNTVITGQKFTKFVHDVARLLPFSLIFWKKIYDRPICCRTLKQRVKVGSGDVCKHLLNLTGCHGNVPWEPGKDTCAHQNSVDSIYITTTYAGCSWANHIICDTDIFTSKRYRQFEILKPHLLYQFWSMFSNIFSYLGFYVVVYISFLVLNLTVETKVKRYCGGQRSELSS